MKKIISLIITVCFIVSTLNNISFASSISTNKFQVQNSFIENLLPKDLGKITYSKMQDTNNIVINIQDLHANSKTQQNINDILTYISNKNNIKSIYLEGASDKIDISKFKNSQNNGNTEIVNLLTDIGILTGTEMFAINDKKNIPLYGLEDKKTHRENIKRLSLMIDNNEFITDKLLSIKKDLNILSNKFINSKNKEFLKLLNNYNAKKTDNLHFYTSIINYIEEISKNSEKYNNLINLKKEDYPNIILFKDLLVSGKQINKQKIYKEIKDMLSVLKNKLSTEEYSLLLSSTKNLTNLTSFINYLENSNIKEDLNLEKKYPNINFTIQYQRSLQSINFADMIEEEKILTDNIKNALSYDTREYEITFLNDFYSYLEKALTNNLTAQDYDYFIKSIDSFELLYPKYVVYNQLKDIQKYIDNSKTFYKVNNERNYIFLEKIKKDIVSNTKDKNIIIVVTGGYHTKGLKELLSQLNVSFVSITPKINNLTTNTNIYNNIISEESKEYNKNTLAFTIASQMQDTTFIKTLINAALQNKVPFQQIKQICGNIFKERFTDNETYFTLNIDSKPITIVQKNGYAVFDSDIDIANYESLSNDLSVLAQDIDSSDNKISIKLLLNLLNVINHYQSFDNLSLTQQNDILKAIINTLVFMVENLNIQFSNGFEQEYIEEYVNTAIINNSSRTNKTLNGIDINTARFLPKVIQSILYENDKTADNISTRISQALKREDLSGETAYLAKHYQDMLQTSGLLSSIIKEILNFVENDNKIDAELKLFFKNFINIADISNYITVAVFNLDDNAKGISLAEGLIGLNPTLKFPELIEGMGHEFAHEMLLRLKEYIATDITQQKTKLLAHESHSYLFSILFAQIFNNILSSSFSDTENYRDYNNFLLDLNNLYSTTIKRNLTDKTKDIDQSKEVHVAALNFINILNKCLGKDGKIMSLQNLIYLTQSIREIFLADKFEENPYSSVFYKILMDFAKKVNPNSKIVLDKYHNQIIANTNFFTMKETDNDSLLIETFANILLTGTSQEIENFINDKIVSPKKDIDKYRIPLRNIYIKTLKIDQRLYEITDEIFFTILGNKVLLLQDNLSDEVLKIISETSQQTAELLRTCKDIGIKDFKGVLNKILTALKEQKDTENFTPEDIEDIFIKSLNLIVSNQSLFDIKQDNSKTYETINDILPKILKKHNKILNLETVINLIITPSIYQNIDITKEILKTTDNLEETLEILTELFVTLAKDYDISFNKDIVNPAIKNYAKSKETISQIPVNIFSKLPSFIQEILYNTETSNITRQKNEFTREFYLQDKNKTNALLKSLLQEIYTLIKNQGYNELLSIPNTDALTIFAGQIASGVSRGNSIAVNPNDENFLNVMAHELGHVLFANAGFSENKSIIIHELYAYTLGLLATTIYNDPVIEEQKMLPVNYNNIVDTDEHSLPKTLLQLIIDAKGTSLNENELLSILKACREIFQQDISNYDNITLAYKILEILEQDETFMKNFMPNALTIKLESILDENQERKDKILQQLFNVSVPNTILIVDKETFLRNQEENIIFIDRKVLNEIFDQDGNIIEGKEQEFYYLTELVRLQVIQQYDLTKQERINDFERLYYCFKDLENMLKQGPFSKYSVTFKKDVNREVSDNNEFIYINPEYLKKIDSSKYSDYLTSLVILRFLENKFNKEFNTDAKFDFYVGIDNLSDISIDLQKFSSMSNAYEYLKQEYNKQHSKQQTIEKAIETILTNNKVKDKKLFANKIKNLMIIVENKNIDFLSIEFFRELSSNINYSAIQQVYNNLIETYSYLIENNLLTFNSSFGKEIEDYITSEKTDNLDGVKKDIAIKMPNFIQNLLYKNMILEKEFKSSPDFIKTAKYKSNKLNGLLNLISQDITNIVARIYPEIDKEILSAQIFFSSLQRLTDGANYGNNKIAVSNRLIKRNSHDPKTLVMEILKTISHELGHEELILKGVSESNNIIDTLHELYAYLIETLLIKSYSQIKGFKETDSVFTTNEKSNILTILLDNMFMVNSKIKNFILRRTDEHDQALDILLLLQQDQYKELFPEEKIVETLSIIENFTHGISFEEDGITKVLRVDDLNMQAVSFFMLMFMFGGELNITEQKFLQLSKSLTVFNTELFDPNKILEAFIRKDTDYVYNLIDEITVKGNARISEINDMLFGDKTFDFNGKTYGYSITTNRSENGLLKDDKILIYFTPEEVKFMEKAITDNKKFKFLKKKTDILTTNISHNPYAYVLLQQINVVANKDSSISTVKELVQAPIQRTLAVATFMLDILETIKDLVKPSPFKNSQSINVAYYDDLYLIEPSKNILSVYISEQETTDIPFEITEYTINGRALRISYSKKDNFITAYCPQASKQEIVEMTAKYIKSNITSKNNNVNLKNIVIDSNVLPDTITYHLSQDNEGFTCISSNFMELGIDFVEDLLELDDIESVMFSKQIYDYIGNIPFKQILKILQDKSLGDNRIIIDSDVLLREMTPNQIMLKSFLKATQLEIVVKVSSQQEMEQINNIYELTNFMLETETDNIVKREIMEYTPSQGTVQKAPVSYIELTDLTNIEDILENIPSHQAIVISVNSESAKNINISDNMILNSLKITITRILKSKTISTKTAGNMGKELSKLINISDEEKENLANRYKEIKNSLTADNLTKLVADFPNVFASQIQSYMEKLYDEGSTEITPALVAFIDNLIDDVLYDDNIEDLNIENLKLDDIKYYKNILSAA